MAGLHGILYLAGPGGHLKKLPSGVSDSCFVTDYGVTLHTDCQATNHNNLQCLPHITGPHSPCLHQKLWGSIENVGKTGGGIGSDHFEKPLGSDTQGFDGLKLYKNMSHRSPPPPVLP